MRWLIRLIVVLACLWGGYWFVGARGLENAAQRWFETLPAQGISASHQGLSVQGFPNRFDLTLTDPRFEDPAQGLRWQAPFLQILSLAYKPWHVIAALPPEQTLTIAGETLTLRADKLQASIVVVPDTSLALDRVVVAGTTLNLSGSSGLLLDADELHFATRQDASRTNAHEAALDIRGIRPPAGLAAQAIAAGLPGDITDLSARVVVQFTAPVDRLMAQTRPQADVIDIRNIQMNWGDISVAAQGSLRADAAGRADGVVTLQITNWEKALDAAVILGVVAPETMASWRNGIQFLAAQSPVPGRLDLPVSFRDGMTRLGLLTLGPAPMLHQPQRQ